MMDLAEFIHEFLDEFDVLVANWQKKKKGFKHHDARRLVRTGIINVLVGKPRVKLGRPAAEQETVGEKLMTDLNDNGEGPSTYS